MTGTGNVTIDSPATILRGIIELEGRCLYAWCKDCPINSNKQRSISCQYTVMVRAGEARDMLAKIIEGTY